MAHAIHRPPDFDQVLSVTVSGHRSRTRSWPKGVEVVFAGRSNTPAGRIRAGEQAAGRFRVAGAPRSARRAGRRGGGALLRGGGAGDAAQLPRHGRGADGRVLRRGGAAQRRPPSCSPRKRAASASAQNSGAHGVPATKPTWPPCSVKAAVMEGLSRAAARGMAVGGEEGVVGGVQQQRGDADAGQEAGASWTRCSSGPRRGSRAAGRWPRRRTRGRCARRSTRRPSSASPISGRFARYFARRVRRKRAV